MTWNQVSFLCRSTEEEAQSPLNQTHTQGESEMGTKVLSKQQLNTLYVILIAAFALAACASQTTGSAVSTEAPIVVPTAIARPTVTPAATASQTVVPTATPQPSITPKATEKPLPQKGSLEQSVADGRSVLSWETRTDVCFVAVAYFIGKATRPSGFMILLGQGACTSQGVANLLMDSLKNPANTAEQPDWVRETINQFIAELNR